MEPSAADFVFASPPRGITAAAVAERLRDGVILVRRLALPVLDEAFRFTVGDGQATDRVLAVVSSLNGSTLSGT